MPYGTYNMECIDNVILSVCLTYREMAFKYIIVFRLLQRRKLKCVPSPATTTLKLIQGIAHSSASSQSLVKCLLEVMLAYMTVLWCRNC